MSKDCSIETEERFRECNSSVHLEIVVLDCDIWMLFQPQLDDEISSLLAARYTIALLFEDDLLPVSHSCFNLDIQLGLALDSLFSFALSTSLLLLQPNPLAFTCWAVDVVGPDSTSPHTRQLPLTSRPFAVDALLRLETSFGSTSLTDMTKDIPR